MRWLLQLAVATADLALQYVGWQSPVEDVVDKYDRLHAFDRDPSLTPRAFQVEIIERSHAHLAGISHRPTRRSVSPIRALRLHRIPSECLGEHIDDPHRREPSSVLSREILQLWQTDP